MIQLVAKTALSVGSVLVLASGVLLFVITPGTSGFVVSIINLIMGALMIGVGVFAVRVVAHHRISASRRSSE